MSDPVRIGGGRLRVDAARALEKLREYQLPDPTLWTLEVVRGAVLLGATALFVEADSDDVWIGFEGPPLDEADLTRLFDDLLGSGGERRAQRLLATGVNTALALGPRFVDVWSIDGASARRTRYTAHLLRGSSEGHADGLRALIAEAVPRCEAVLGVKRGGAVHVRRGLGMETLGRFLRGEVPIEVQRVLSATTSLRIPIHAQPRALPPPPPLLTLALDEKRTLARGWVEIVAAERASGPALLMWSELGVLLAADPLPLGPVRDGSRAPLMVRLDFDRLPTNAARSAVRREPLVEDAEREALAVAKDAIAALGEALKDLGDPRHPALRAAALAMVHAYTRAEPEWQKQVLALEPSHFLRPLIEAPSMRNALGAPKSLLELARLGETTAYRGAAAVRPELAPWMDGVPWIPLGDPALALYGETPPTDAGELLAFAERRMAARLRYLEAPEVALAFNPEPRDLFIASLETGTRMLEGSSWVPRDAFEIPGLEGQLVLSAPSAEPRGEIVFLVLRRVIHRMRVPSEVPFRAVITAATLRANPEYTGLLDQDALGPLVRALGWAAVAATEGLAAQLSGESAVSARLTPGPGLANTDRARLEETVRGGMRLALRLSESSALDRPTPASKAAVFSTVGGDRLSLAGLREAAKSGTVIGTTRPTRARLADRVLLALSEADAEMLTALLTMRTRHKSLARVVHYGDQLEAPRLTPTDVGRAFPRARALLTEDFGEARAAFALLEESDAPKLSLSHAGRAIAEAPPLLDAHLPLGLRVDDDRLVPTPNFESVAIPERLATPLYDVARWSEKLAAAIASHLCGATPPALRLTVADPLTLLILLAELVLDGGSLDRAPLAELPILPRLGGGTQRFSFFRLAGALRLPFVAPVVGARFTSSVEGIEAAILPEKSAVALARFFGVEALDRTSEVRERWIEHDRERAWAAFFERPADAPSKRDERAVSLSGHDIVGGFAQPALLAASRLRITVRGRLLREHRGAEAPHALEAHVDVDPKLVDIDAADLNATGTSRVAGALRDATRRLLEERATTNPTALAHDRALIDLALAFIETLPTKRSEPVRRVLDALLDAPGFPMLTGVGSVRSALRPQQREVWLTYGIDGWLGPATQKKNALDEANVLALPEREDGEPPWVRLAQALVALLAPSRDVTKSARRLREARRVAASSGPLRVPTWIDRRFAVDLAELAKNAAEGEMLLEVFPQGEAALVEEGQTRLILVNGGVGSSEESTHTYSFVPPVFIVARSPDAAHLDEPESRARVEEAVRTVVAELLRYTADHVPHATWSSAIKKAVRGAALLGGNAHLDRLASIDLFPTTAGRFVSYADLREQVNRFGDLWVVKDPSVTLLPLDEARVALSLAEHEAPLLHAVLPTVDGTTELLLDQRARTNRAQPKVASIEPSAIQQQRALGVRRLEVEGGHAWVLALAPKDALHRAMHTFLDRLPLGVGEDPCRWPTLSFVSSSAFTPNRVHEQPIADEAFAAIGRAIAAASEALVAEALALDAPVEPGALVVQIDAAFSRSVLGERGSEVRGVLSWGGVAMPELMMVQIGDALGTREANLSATPPLGLSAKSLPLVGHLTLTADDALTLPLSKLEALARRAYVQMLEEAGRRWRNETNEAQELALAALVQGAITLHLAARKDAWLKEPLPCVLSAEGKPKSLQGMMEALRAKAPVFVLTESERGALDPLPRESLVILDDGSLPSRVAITHLRPQTLRAWLTLTALDLEAEPAGDAVKEDPKPATPAKPKHAKPKGAKEKGAKEKVAAQKPARAEGTLLRRLTEQVHAIDPNAKTRLDPQRTTPLIDARGAEVSLAGNSALLLALAQAPEAWDEACPVLAAEMVAARGKVSELDAIERLLESLERD